MLFVVAVLYEPDGVAINPNTKAESGSECNQCQISVMLDVDIHAKGEITAPLAAVNPLKQVFGVLKIIDKGERFAATHAEVQA